MNEILKDVVEQFKLFERNALIKIIWTCMKNGIEEKVIFRSFKNDDLSNGFIVWAFSETLMKDGYQVISAEVVRA